MAFVESRHVTSAQMVLCFQISCILLMFSFPDGTAKVMESIDSKNSSSILRDQPKQDDEAEMDCIDWEGKAAADGEKYTPYGRDLCTQCMCENRFPVACHSVACSAPQDCPNARPVAGKCCEYECLPGNSMDNGNKTGIGKDYPKDTQESITNLSLRLIASTVTSLLFLALLLFLVYRLRQRRLLRAMRRFEARSRNSNMNEDTDSDHYIPENFLALECPPYTDPPPPYSPPKPPHIYLGEQPPPYDEISLAGNTGDMENGGRPPPPRRSASGSELTSVPVSRSQMQTSQNASERRIPQLAPHIANHSSSSRYPVETLPAYASTDVVQGINTMLSSRTSAFQRNWDDWSTDGLGVQLEQQNSNHDRNSSTNASHGHQHSSVCPVRERHNLPPFTAFQRFSSLFKRNALKSKNRNSQSWSMSECQHPASHYATVPHNDQGANVSSGYTNFSNPIRQARTSARSVTRSLTDRMCFSYDSARAAYELAAMSPSTSSNSSSSGGLASCSPRGRETSQQNPLHSQQFQDDLRRHLPPLQTSDSSEFVAQTSPGTCPSILSPSSSPSTNQTLPCHPEPSSRNYPQEQASDHTIPQADKVLGDDVTPYERETTTSIIYDLTGSLPHLRSSPCTPSHSHAQSVKVDGRPEGSPNAQRSSDIHHRNSSFPQNSPARPSRPSPSQRHISPETIAMTQNSSNSLCSGVGNARRSENNTPSPPLLGGLMKRSQSAMSELSMFSVCSETGEKKLKDGEAGADTKVLASDCQYPNHHSLSGFKPGTSSQRTGGSPLQHASRIERSNHSVANNIRGNSSYVRNVKDMSGNDSHVAATLFVPTSCDLSEEGVDDVKGTTSQDSRMNEGSHSVGFKETESGQGSETMVDGGQSTNHTSADSDVRPSSPFVTAQSGKLIPVPLGRPKSHSHPDPDVKLAVDAKHCHTESKKIKRKKNGKEKHHVQPLAQHHQKSKSLANAAPGVNISNLVKPDVPFRDAQIRTSSKSRSSRNGEKKKRTVSSLVPPLEHSDILAPERMAHSCDDTLMNVGNADVYRSYGCDVQCAPISLPGEHPSVCAYADSKIGVGSGREHCDVPLAYTSLATADGNMGQANMGHVDRPLQPPQTKKKPAHKRQVSAGEKIHNRSSPSRQRPRPKSSTGDRSHSRKGEPESASFEHGPSVGKGAKSGFGHDLNFDDQMGMIDYFNEGVDYSATKTRGRASFSNDSCFPLPSSVRSHTRSGTESGSQYQHGGNNRSGLSNDLSFVQGSCPAGEKGKKRASLPSLPMFSHVMMNSGAKNQGGKVVEEKTGREEERNRKCLPEDDYSQATSYV